MMRSRSLYKQHSTSQSLRSVRLEEFSSMIIFHFLPDLRMMIRTQVPNVISNTWRGLVWLRRLFDCLYEGFEFAEAFRAALPEMPQDDHFRLPSDNGQRHFFLAMKRLIKNSCHLSHPTFSIYTAWGTCSKPRYWRTSFVRLDRYYRCLCS
jgi:hypothetical protein